MNGYCALNVTSYVCFGFESMTYLLMNIFMVGHHDDINDKFR